MKRILFPSLLWSFARVAFFLAGVAAASGQSTPGTVRGTITDPTGAVVPSATVLLTGTSGDPRAAMSGRDGTYEFTGVAPGSYTLSVTMKGFAPADIAGLTVAAGHAVLKNVALALPVEQQQVQVNSEASGVSTAPDNNAGAIVIKGKDLDALSDDPDDLQNELTALAGPAAGPSGGQIYIDGFSGGQLPPKSSIREIRINQNPFSAQYDKLGYGRIEILTKPGTDKLRGMFMMSGNDSAFNSLTPLVTTEPSYYSTFMVANASGSAGKSASWFANVFRRDNQSNSIISATLADGSSYSKAVATPQSRLDVSPRFDLQLGKNNTLTVRYSFNRDKETNAGVSGTSLESQAYDSLNHENVIQLSDTQVLSANTVNETRFQYIRDRDSEAALNSTPSVSVSGSFTSGGNTVGTVRSNEDHYEFQDYVTSAMGRHSLNYGTRLRYDRLSSYSTSGFNSSYIYDSLGMYNENKPSQYSITTGTPSAKLGVFDASVFFQDDMKVRQNLTLSYGLRWESQNQISDHSDWAPRFSLAWAPSKLGSKTVIRGGYGWFYDRFSTANLLTAERQNGINQLQYVTKYTYDDAGNLVSTSSPAPTLYKVDPGLTAAVSMQGAIGVERQIAKIATVSATYLYSRGVHQYLSSNVNAYIPDSYDAATGTGTRPNGVDENIYQFGSGGVFRQNQLIVNYSIRAKKLSLFGFYMLNSAKADTSGASYFPSNQFNPGADYGRASFDVRNRFLLGGNYQGPFGISFSPMFDANSGTPFNITLQNDLNGDNQYNDRPAWATASSTSVATTKYGNFDTDPAWNAARIPYDYGTGPSEWSLNMRVAKSVGIGPRVTSTAGSSFGPGGGPPPGGGPRGGGPGGGLGPGGLSGQRGGPPRLDQDLPRRYQLNFSVMSHNVLNKVNWAAPGGVIGTSLFGKSNSLAGGFFSSAAANRTIDLQVSFSF